MTMWQLSGWGLWLIIAIRFFPREFWPKLKSEPSYQHLVFSSILSLSILWSINAGIINGLNIHFLLLTTLVLSHGWRIAMLLCVLISLALIVFQRIPLADAGLFALTTFIIPGLFSYLLFLASYRYLTRHLFVYIFIAGFIGAALTIALHMLLVSLWFYAEGRFTWDIIYDNYLRLSILTWFPEALLNGSAITLMAIYKPHWLRTFYDREYLSPER
ncbi:energy-coupling factor ABC transporter permease [Rheinheimera sp. WS51]|uniref:energy-coupling factor ABC transporter permease n=1 Tax=Rheinheimera sp. WS51 TaxID=3425886 RepID=UPI003D8FF358